MDRMNALILVITILAFCTNVRSAWPPECKDEMIINDTCYVFYDSTVNFNSAESSCQSKDGTLAIIKNSVVNKKLSEYLQKGYCITNPSESSRVWIGLKYKSGTDSYRYSDDTELLENDYNALSGIKPYYHGQYCVALSPSYQNWYHETCDNYRKYVCQFKASTCNTQFINVTNGEFDNCYRSSEILFGFNVTIKCQKGYLLVGAASVSCLGYGQWSEMPKCIRGCKPPPPSYPNAKMFYSKDYYIVDDVALYVCDEGFFSNRHPEKTHFTITCSSNGEWTPPSSGCSHSKKYQVKEIAIMFNDTLKLSCDTNKSSAFVNKSNGSYFWLKDSTYLSSTQLDYEEDLEGGLAVYSNSTETIEGLYMCFMNGEKLIPGNTVYDVKHRKVVECDEQSTDNKIHYVYKEGASALLSCPHSTSYERFHWYKDGEYFQLNDDHVLYPDGSLYIRKIEFSHQGIYTCMMTIKDTSCSKNITAEVVVLVSSESICDNLNKSPIHPWIVSLWWKDELAPFCYGTLIHENWVITTAHCLSGFYRKRKLNIFARLGNNPIKDMSSAEKNENNVIDNPIVMAKIHPLFSKKRYVNDIGLVKLKKPVQFSNTIQPICFTEIDLTIKAPCDQSPPVSGTAIGWGSLERDDVGEVSLAEENMTFVPHETCFPTESFYSNKVLCFEKTTGTTDTLVCDSGSPLEVLWNDRVYLLGIYSWGDRSSHLGKYDYFTKTSTYVSWFSTFLREE